MTPADFDQAAVDLDLYRRAAARCTVSEPHRDTDEDVPCSGCLLAGARQLAIPASHLSALASASPGAAARLRSGDADGAADRDRRSVAAPPSVESNQPRAENPRLAESGPVRPQTGR